MSSRVPERRGCGFTDVDLVTKGIEQSELGSAVDGVRGPGSPVSIPLSAQFGVERLYPTVLNVKARSRRAVPLVLR